MQYIFVCFKEQVAPTETRMPLRRRRLHRVIRKNIENMGTTGHTPVRHRPLAAAHFSGDTSRYEQGKHEHYNGEKLLIFIDGFAGI